MSGKSKGTLAKVHDNSPTAAIPSCSQMGCATPLRSCSSAALPPQRPRSFQVFEQFTRQSSDCVQRPDCSFPATGSTRRVLKRFFSLQGFEGFVTWKQLVSRVEHLLGGSARSARSTSTSRIQALGICRGTCRLRARGLFLQSLFCSQAFSDCVVPGIFWRPFCSGAGSIAILTAPECALDPAKGPDLIATPKIGSSVLGRGWGNLCEL